jgi:hypothetical protein
MDSITSEFYSLLQFEASESPELSIPAYAKTAFEGGKKVPCKLSQMASLAIIAQSDNSRVRRYSKIAVSIS